MSERLPYELQLQQQWIDLPLPDENLAWADMKRRLEEDDDRPVVAWWRKGCGIWIGLGLIALIAIWWWLRPEQWFISESSTKQELSVEPTDKSTVGTIPPSNSSTNTDGPSTATRTTNDPGPVNSNLPLTSSNETGKPNATPAEKSVAPSNTSASSSITSAGGGISGRKQTLSRTNANSQQPGTSKPLTSNPKPTASTNRPQQPVKNNNTPNLIKTGDIKTDPVNNNPAVPPADTITLSTNNSVAPSDSSIAKTDSVKKKDSTTTKPPVASTPKTDSAKKKNIFFSAGIAMHQQIPLSGQKLTPYNASGRKFSLADYIPSIYFRINKEVNNKSKWFIQGEFRYGAPNYTRDIVYKNQTKRDSAGPNTTAYIINTKMTVKKTFYHQLPVSFNYYILPDLSIGGGVAWNKFSSAIVDRQNTGRNAITQQDTTFPDNGIISVRRDSVFSNSYFQAILESHYKWKRFSFGARYMFGLQPFLEFDVPGGTRKEKNSSLQLFIRYELWRSKKR